MSRLINKGNLHWWLPVGLVVGRLILGVIFVFAAYMKLKAPWIEFAGELNAYELLPEWALEPLAKALPWVELALGVALISGIWQRWFALITSLLLTLFFVVMLRSYIVGLKIDCGCFGPGEVLGPKTLARDFSMLALAVAVTIGSFRPKSSVSGGTVWNMSGRLAAGLVLITTGAALALWGVNLMNSLGAQLAETIGLHDNTGLIAVGAGVVLGLIGVALLSTNGSRSHDAPS